MEGIPTLVGERDAAQALNVAVQTLRNWRFTGTGVPYQKIGRRVSYRVDDIREFLERTRIDPDRQLRG